MIKYYDMKKMMDKKAQYFNMMMVIAFIIAMTIVFVFLHAKYRDMGRSLIGEKQFEVIKAYQEAEKAQLYIDLSAQFSAKKAAEELRNYAGTAISIMNDCGFYDIAEENDASDPVILWENKEKKCYPSKSGYELAFEQAFNMYMNGYLAAYPAEK